MDSASELMAILLNDRFSVSGFQCHLILNTFGFPDVHNLRLKYHNGEGAVGIFDNTIDLSFLPSRLDDLICGYWEFDMFNPKFDPEELVSEIVDKVRNV